MFKRFKLLKNQKGLTLIELLVVVVILGIIAAIAVPSVGGLIDNSRKDAHVGNAQQMVNATKLVITSNATLSSGTHFVTLGYLEAEKYLDPVKDPDGDLTTYVRGPAAAPNDIVTGTTAPTTGSFVKVEAGIVTEVKLVNGTRGVQASGNAAVLVKDLNRDAVNNNTVSGG